MENFITKIKINKVRHLKDIEIELSKVERKHLIITGKNGSGKTSLIESIKTVFETENSSFEDIDIVLSSKEGLGNDCFILGYYSDNRIFEVLEARHIEKVKFEKKYSITQSAGKQLVKYLLDLKSTLAFIETTDEVRANNIRKWFARFEDLLKKLFDDQTLSIDFDVDTFKFFINTKNREPFEFSQMSSGYSAILEITADIMLKMEQYITDCYNLQGIVLIDEVETHLHLDLQKKILPLLIEFFPKVQFIITTHSPFILNSADNSVIYDLENRVQIDNGLKNLPYSGVIEGYFNVNTLSEELKTMFEQYKELSQKSILDDNDYVLLSKLEFYLDEIPDYLAIDVTNEYNRLKLDFESRV